MRNCKALFLSWYLLLYFADIRLMLKISLLMKFFSGNSTQAANMKRVDLS